MKGFPNQVADLAQIAVAVGTLADLVERGQDARDDGVYGQALVRAGVAGTGHVPMEVEAYIRGQLRKPASGQSFRTTARGLRELFRLFGFIHDDGQRVLMSASGLAAAALAGQPFPTQSPFWRTSVRDLRHRNADDEVSHPYQVLLRLVARKPGITRAKCALALEARNDSSEELDRICQLADVDEQRIRLQIGVTQANWDNAKKVLPKFAEQLGDVIRTGQTFVIADAPGRAEFGPTTTEGGQGAPQTRAPRASRGVTPETIGRAGTADRFDEVQITAEMDPEAARRAIAQRLDRLRRHNLIVQALARRFALAGASLHEDPFDVLAIIGDSGVLVEVKSLDGLAADERNRVQEALAQLLYYEAFVTAPVAGQARLAKIACFENEISAAHQEWLNAAGIGCIWKLEGDNFGGDNLGCRMLIRYLASEQ